MGRELIVMCCVCAAAAFTPSHTTPAGLVPRRSLALSIDMAAHKQQTISAQPKTFAQKVLVVFSVLTVGGIAPKASHAGGAGSLALSSDRLSKITTIEQAQQELIDIPFRRLCEGVKKNEPKSVAIATGGAAVILAGVQIYTCLHA